MGIDIPIQQLQKMLYTRLCGKWNLDEAGKAWVSYGRAYKNEAEDGYLPEVYVGNGEYKDAFYDDNHTVISFFGVDASRPYNAGFSADVYLILSMNIVDLKPSITHRADEEIHNDVSECLDKPRHGFTMTGLITGMYDIFDEYRMYRPHLMRNTKSIKFRDMHPLHIFRVNMSLLYKNSNC